VTRRCISYIWHLTYNIAIWTDRGVGFQSVGDDQTVVSRPLLCSRKSTGSGDDDVSWTLELTANCTRHVADWPATGEPYHGLTRRTWLALVLVADGDVEYPCNNAKYTPTHTFDTACYYPFFRHLMCSLLSP